MIEAGIRTIDAFSFLADEVGGVENIGFTRRDAYNFIQKNKKEQRLVDEFGRIDYDCFDDVVIFIQFIGLISIIWYVYHLSGLIIIEKIFYLGWPFCQKRRLKYLRGYL
ncbi:hypothetical protein MA16_Dca022956 [Dendrobium catenatum]|uniref:Uncharacterized protein n=1 Tax=Dendrobium catenatum TaxID=906689 RepID=A0A2I0VXB5_9ASPA|nr:hypothetical protein MA16_Dca022956 [Dendrobium catenatum]